MRSATHGPAGLARALVALAGAAALACGGSEPAPPPAPSLAPRPAAAPAPVPAPPPRPPGPAHVGSAACALCHAEEHERWTGSHHDLAMQVATRETVLGDFEDAVFEHLGRRTRFFRRGDEHWVEAEGRDGEPAEHRVLWTFGVEPLQQYLCELEDGWVQALDVAWDTERGAWFTLYPDERHAPSDPLHWTGRYQSWNAMCADCHSTGVVKGYDPVRDAFDTAFAEIDVACEACHGPGERHVEWAQEGDAEGLPGGDDPQSVAARQSAMGLALPLGRGMPAAQVDACAPCHSRRTNLIADPAVGEGFLDARRPELLIEGSYHPDGSMLGEVYVWGSFAQSRMHARGVACTDCHDPHSLELLAPGNAVCTQCHSPHAPLERFPTLQAKVYDAPEHHRHPEGSEGARCASCHMPTTTYMVVDPRREHAFRVPRPDLAAELGTPDACSACHSGEGEGPAWAAARVAEWFGEERAPHFARAFARARRGERGAAAELAAIAADAERPGIVRASALEHLRRLTPQAVDTGRELLQDPDALVRNAAVRTFEALEPLGRIAELVKVLEDPSLAVRSEAARLLAPARQDIVEVLAPDSFERALGEWIAAQRASAELPWAHLNLGVLAEDRGDTVTATGEYRRALEQDPLFLPARFNLSNLCNRTGRNLEAERVLREGVALAPDEGELHYSLGLLLAEMGRLPDAAPFLLRAAELLPGRARVRYNAGLALDRAGRDDEAERLLLEASALDPEDADVLHALALFYEEQGQPVLALPYADRLLRKAPESEAVNELYQRLRAAARSR